MITEVHFQVGHLQAGAANGRVIVVTRTSEAVSEIQLSAKADGYRFNGALSAQSTTSGVARALASLGIAVFHAELPGPIPPGELELAASWPGSEVFTQKLHPIASALPDAGLAFVLGSCLYGNETFVETLASALERAIGPASGRGDWSIANPKFALFLGDNVYLDVHPDRVGGDASRHTAAIYAKAFALSAASARVMGALPVLSTFDDHEFYDGYPETEPHVMRTWLPHVRASFVAAAHDGIALFQQAKNPTPVASEGCSFRFDIAPLSFFALDTRTTRTRLRIEQPELCREAEIAAFETWAQGLTAPGIFVISQPLFSPKGSYIEPSFSEFQGHYERILKALRDAPFTPRQPLGMKRGDNLFAEIADRCLLYTSPSPRD